MDNGRWVDIQNRIEAARAILEAAAVSEADREAAIEKVYVSLTGDVTGREVDA